MIGFSFREVMEGTLERDGERFDRPFRFEFDVRVPELFFMFRTVEGRAVGDATIDGLAKHARAEGTIELSPVVKRRLHYKFTFDVAGERYRFDGFKSIRWTDPLRTWTTLPGTVYAPDGSVYGKAVLRFVFRRHLEGLVKSLRLLRRVPVVAHASAA
jgi:hypothetical protein